MDRDALFTLKEIALKRPFVINRVFFFAFQTHLRRDSVRHKKSIEINMMVTQAYR